MNYKLQNRTPQIRFPEFQGEWEHSLLGKLIYKTDKKNKENLNLPVYSINNIDGFIPQAEQFEGRNSSERGFDISIYKIIYKNTFVYNPARINVGSIGYSYDLDNILVSSLYVCFRTEKQLNDTFLLQFIKTNSFNTSILRFEEGGVRKYLFFDNISKIPISFPTLPEQKRIAHFFTVLDNKINQLKEKKALLEEYKKGMMQKIFSQEIRFKPAFDKSSAGRDDYGKEFDEWEEKRLGSEATFFSGGTPTSTNKDYYFGDIPFIKSGEINSGETDQFLSKNGLDNSSAKIVEVGDLLYALYGATSGEVGISKINGAINQAVLCIRTQTYNKTFLVNYLVYSKEKITGTYLQGGQGNLSADIVKGLKIPTPKKPEQTKIANFLSKIDDKIKTVNEQIEETKEYKKGMLQMMYVN